MEITLSAETYLTACNLLSTVQSEIRKIFKEKICPNYYGDEFTSIGIIPIIMPVEYHKFHPERRLIKRKAKEADIRLFIDYKEFVKGACVLELEKYAHKRKLMVVKNIVDSIMVVENRKKGDFQGLRLIDDILKVLGVDRQELDCL